MRHGERAGKRVAVVWAWRRLQKVKLQAASWDHLEIEKALRLTIGTLRTASARYLRLCKRNSLLAMEKSDAWSLKCGSHHRKLYGEIRTCLKNRLKLLQSAGARAWSGQTVANRSKT